jgi:hypothetical protein
LLEQVCTSCTCGFSEGHALIIVVFTFFLPEMKKKTHQLPLFMHYPRRCTQCCSPKLVQVPAGQECVAEIRHRGPQVHTECGHGHDQPSGPGGVPCRRGPVHRVPHHHWQGVSLHCKAFFFFHWGGVFFSFIAYITRSCCSLTRNSFIIYLCRCGSAQQQETGSTGV